MERELNRVESKKKKKIKTSKGEVKLGTQSRPPLALTCRYDLFKCDSKKKKTNKDFGSGFICSPQAISDMSLSVSLSNKKKKIGKNAALPPERGP